MTMKKLLFFGAALLMAAACSKGGYNLIDGDYSAREYGGAMSDADGPGWGGGEGGAGHNGGQAGILTAGEWNDLIHWDFWGGLMSREPAPEGEGIDPEQQVPDYAGMAYMWGFNTSRRVAVRVSRTDGTPAANAKVQLYQGNDLLWTTRTSNKGEAQLWQDLFSPKGQESTSTTPLTVVIEGVAQTGSPAVCSWTSAPVNEYVADITAPQPKADIAFIVDATGSMTDEIDFLKKDLLDILGKVQQSQSGVSIRTGAVFYRDKGDDYLTRSSEFGTPANTMSFIKKQEAGGGGDLPEAVHSALSCALSELTWDATARARMAFLILDAPAHQDQQGVVESLQKSIRNFATEGIRLVPVLASTGDKTTEFMCRDFAIATGGTYVFLTDDSQVGGEHLTPSVGEYAVEKLNDLLVRLIGEYIAQ